MVVMVEMEPNRLDYDRCVAEYARHRRVHPAVVEELIASALLNPETHVLDIGCGTGNYAAALQAATGCRVSGIDPAANMLDRARGAAVWEALEQGSAERLPFADRSFDLVMSTDVIHHVRDRNAFFREAARVLRRGGQLTTVTDSHDDIARRRPLSSHFPETTAIEFGRYPSVPRLIEEMSDAGFEQIRTRCVSREYELTDIQAYRDRAFSSLLLLGDEEFRRGIARLEAELSHGPIRCVSLYTVIWGQMPLA
jgi:ubiquinone/menaquinone biosynthesis C-methylase UbiE